MVFYLELIISITSPNASGASFPIGILVLTFIALMKFFPKSVCNLNAKSNAVVPFGIKKQSGITFPY